MNRWRGFLLCMGLLITLILAGCGGADQEAVETILTSTYDSQISLPRSDIRDVVRDAAVLENGQPLFSRIETDYGFTGDRFRVNGLYTAPDGTEQPGWIDLVFAVNDGGLQVKVVEHTLQGVDAAIPSLESAIAQGLEQLVAETMGVEVASFLSAKPESTNMLIIGMRLAAPLDDGVIPLDVP